MELLQYIAAVTVQHVLLAPLIIVSLSLLGLCAYRLWFHPLARFPGPFLGRITNLYGAYYAWKGDGHIHMLHCHEKYGDLVRYAPGRLLVNTHTGMKAIYSHRSDCQKSNVYNVMVHRAPNTLTCIDKKAHGRKRRLVSQGLSDAAVRSYEPIILEQLEKFCNALAPSETEMSGTWSAPRNIAKLANYLTFDIMSAAVFGEAFHLLDKEENRFVPECIEASNVRTAVLIQAQELTTGRLDRRLFKTAIHGRNRFIRFVTQLLQTRLAAKPLLREDAFSYLLKAQDPETGEKLSPAELGAEATTLVVAGSDTSSTALAAFFFYLSRHPEVVARATAEVRAAFPEKSSVQLGPTLTGCAYLSACIDESMRLSPPAATALWRETTAPVRLDGHVIPEGVDVGTCTFALHHNPAYFPEPYEFRPDRWLSTKRSPDAQAAFAPFSIGPRSCVGKGLARAELMLAGASVLRRFDFESAPGQYLVGGGSSELGWGRQRQEEYQMWDHITCAKNGPMLRFRSVDHES